MDRTRDRHRTVRVEALTRSTGAVLALALSLAGCSSSRPAARERRDGARLTIANYAFIPHVLTVKSGTKITVANTDSTAHTATSRSGPLDSGTLKPGQSTHLTLSTPGTYTFYCQFHAFMTATVRVVR